MKVLVTGATGYLGGHVAERLVEEGHTVRAATRSVKHGPWLDSLGIERVPGELMDYATLRRACHGMEGVIHCAAMMGHWSRIDETQRAVNVDGSSNLHRAAGRAGVPKTVHVSSIVAVGCTRTGERLTEDAPWKGRDQPDIHYVRTKRESEERAFAAARGGLPITIVNPAAMVGAYAQDGRIKGHVRAALDGTLAKVHPGGSSVAHVRDVASGVVSALTHGAPGERTILAGHDMSWLDLRRTFANAAGTPPPEGERPLWLGRTLAAAAFGLDLLRLSRPRTAYDQFRIWGWYSYADSTKAIQQLGYKIPPFEDTVARILAESQAPPTSE